MSGLSAEIRVPAPDRGRVGLSCPLGARPQRGRRGKDRWLPDRIAIGPDPSPKVGPQRGRRGKRLAPPNGVAI